MRIINLVVNLWNIAKFCLHNKLSYSKKQEAFMVDMKNTQLMINADHISAFIKGNFYVKDTNVDNTFISNVIRYEELEKKIVLENIPVIFNKDISYFLANNSLLWQNDNYKLYLLQAYCNTIRRHEYAKAKYNLMKRCFLINDEKYDELLMEINDNLVTKNDELKRNIGSIGSNMKYERVTLC